MAYQTGCGSRAALMFIFYHATYTSERLPEHSVSLTQLRFCLPLDTTMGHFRDIIPR